MDTPTVEQALEHLRKVAPDRDWDATDMHIIERHGEGLQPSPYCFVAELHWMRGGAIGVRGLPLWWY